MAYRSTLKARRGTTVNLIVVFKKNGALFNPVDISVEIYNPRGVSVTTIVPTPQTLGTYVVPYAVDANAKMGTWQHRWRWQATPELPYHIQTYNFEVVPPGRDLGSASKDLAFVESKIEEQYTLHFPAYPYYVLQTAQVANLNTYGEHDYEDSVTQQELYDDDVGVPMMVRLDPEQDLLDKFGIDEPQESLITLSRKIMDDLGFEPKIGDRFDFNNWQFEFTTMKPGSWFSNTQVPCEFIATAAKVHARNPA